MNYTIVDKPESDGAYPSIVSQFTTLEVPVAEADAAHGSYSCWVPANVRGESAAATTEPQRTKANAPVGSTIFSITGTVQEPDFVGSGFIYYGTSVGPDGDKKNNTVYLWASEHGTKTTSGMLIYQIQDNTISVTHPIDWKFGFSVRCVQDNIRKKP